MARRSYLTLQKVLLLRRLLLFILKKARIPPFQK
jgi:hypothetical protein